MWGLNRTTDNRDPVRVGVKALGDRVDGPTCSAFISAGTSIWNRDYTSFWDAAAGGPLAASNNTIVVNCAAST